MFSYKYSDMPQVIISLSLPSPFRKILCPFFLWVVLLNLRPQTPCTGNLSLSFSQITWIGFPAPHLAKWRMGDSFPVGTGASPIAGMRRSCMTKDREVSVSVTCTSVVPLSWFTGSYIVL